MARIATLSARVAWVGYVNLLIPLSLHGRTRRWQQQDSWSLVEVEPCLPSYAMTSPTTEAYSSMIASGRSGTSSQDSNDLDDNDVSGPMSHFDVYILQRVDMIFVHMICPDMTLLVPRSESRKPTPFLVRLPPLMHSKLQRPDPRTISTTWSNPSASSSIPHSSCRRERPRKRGYNLPSIRNCQ